MMAHHGWGLVGCIDITVSLLSVSIEIWQLYRDEGNWYFSSSTLKKIQWDDDMSRLNVKLSEKLNGCLKWSLSAIAKCLTNDNSMGA